MFAMEGIYRLDGVQDFFRVYKDGYGFKPNEPLLSPTYKQILWARAAAPLHFVLITISTLARQLMRILTSLAALQFGAAGKDCIGLFLQLPLLPALAVLAVINPQWAVDACHHVLVQPGVDHPNDSGTYFEDRGYPWQPYVLTLIRGLFVLPLGLIDGGAQTLSWALTGSWSQLSANQKISPLHRVAYSFAVCIHIPYNTIYPELEPSLIESINLVIYRTRFR